MTSPSKSPGSGPSQPAPPSSRPPPPRRKNDALYAIIGLVFFGAAAGLWMSVGSEDPPAPPAAAPAPQAERVNPMAEPELDLEPIEEPAPEPAVEPEPEADPAPSTAKKRSAAGAGDVWDCDGELPVAQIRGIVDQNRAQVRTCYERRLKVNSLLQGTVRLKLRVGPTGDVTQTQTTGTLRDAEVASCIRTLASGWHFAAPTGGRCVVVEAPFTFEPKGN